MKTAQIKNSNKGFTLIEILVVIAILAILSAVVFVALDPVKRFEDSRNARRVSDVNTILTAIHESIVDTGGTLPGGLTTGMATPLEIGTCAAAAGSALCTAVDCDDLGTALSTYLASAPIDPIGGATYDAVNTGYEVQVDANNIVTVEACAAESTTITVSR
jgi:prepilin-type N-terminal cleavage/methylation domain-containing protein